jgi:hypothetical protein
LVAVLDDAEVGEGPESWARIDREMPGRPRAISLNPSGPNNSSRSTSNVQRSPTISAAFDTGQYWP